MVVVSPTLSSLRKRVAHGFDFGKISKFTRFQAI